MPVKERTSSYVSTNTTFRFRYLFSFSHIEGSAAFEPIMKTLKLPLFQMNGGLNDYNRFSKYILQENYVLNNNRNTAFNGTFG